VSPQSSSTAESTPSSTTSQLSATVSISSSATTNLSGSVPTTSYLPCSTMQHPNKEPQTSVPAAMEKALQLLLRQAQIADRHISHQPYSWTVAPPLPTTTGLASISKNNNPFPPTTKFFKRQIEACQITSIMDVAEFVITICAGSVTTL
jgi:hypothetical protein